MHWTSVTTATTTQLRRVGLQIRRFARGWGQAATRAIGSSVLYHGTEHGEGNLVSAMTFLGAR